MPLVSATPPPAVDFRVSHVWIWAPAGSTIRSSTAYMSPNRPRRTIAAGVAAAARQMSLAEAVEAAADAVTAKVAELRTHADQATLALLEQVMARLGGV